MDKIVLFNTAIASQNMGDYIIVNSCKKELKTILEKKFMIELPTHVPTIHCYQNFQKNKLIEYCDVAKYKFVTGTNLLAFNMLRPWPNFNINIFTKKPFQNVILVGCGLNPNASKVNFYTKRLYKKILAKDYIHSTRDEATKIFLEKLGFKALNTGCATMWSLTKSFCREIPTKKANRVVFTLTDYKKDRQNDQKLIDCLNKNYKEVYFWVQGSGDLEYLRSLLNTQNISIISPQLSEFEEVLTSGNIDYIGTRLHAGIYALQHKVRSIILIVDNRTRDLRKSYHIPAVERNQLSKLENMIHSDFVTDIRIKEKNINQWKKQFK